MMSACKIPLHATRAVRCPGCRAAAASMRHTRPHTRRGLRRLTVTYTCWRSPAWNEPPYVCTVSRVLLPRPGKRELQKGIQPRHHPKVICGPPFRHLSERIVRVVSARCPSAAPHFRAESFERGRRSRHGAEAGGRADAGSAGRLAEGAAVRPAAAARRCVSRRDVDVCFSDGTFGRALSRTVAGYSRGT